MRNTSWTLVRDQPVPKDRTVLLYLAEARHNSRLALSKGGMGTNGQLNVIDGLFYFDMTTPILAWREIDDLLDDIPLELADD